MKRRDVCGVIVLLVYLLGVGLMTGPSLYQLLEGRLPEPRLELIPFMDIVAVLRDTDTPGAGAFINIAGNLVLLAPLGFLLPLFWSYFGSARRTILLAAGMSLSIELIQLIAGGVTSVDDLILNTAGALVGFVLAKLLLRISPRLAPQRDNRAAWGYPLACWLAVIAFATVTDVMVFGQIW